MIESMYRVEMEPPVREGKKKKWTNDGRVFENFRGSSIGHFGFFGADGNLSICVLVKGGSTFKSIEANKLEDAASLIWKEYYKSLSRREKLARKLYSHRAWVAALIVSAISSSIVLATTGLWNWVWN